MARVKYPLWSLSASGQVGNTICYHKVGREAHREISRVINGKAVTAQYEPRIISGQGIARLKPQKRPDLSRKKTGSDELINAQQDMTQARFAFASTLARWIITNRLVVSDRNPTEAKPIIYPWADGLYFQRGENREEIKFPGQATGQTLTARRRITGTNTPTTFIMRQLLSRRFFRFDITLNAFNALSDIERFGWVPSGNAPWNLLPQTFNIGAGQTATRSFANAWIQAAYLIPLFALAKGWLEVGQQNAVWSSPFTRSPNDPVIINYNNHLSIQNEIKLKSVMPWERPS